MTSVKQLFAKERSSWSLIGRYGRFSAGRHYRPGSSESAAIAEESNGRQNNHKPRNPDLQIGIDGNAMEMRFWHIT
jgi:hypothetical protein